MFFKQVQQISMEIRDNVIRFVELKSTDPIVVKRYGERYIPNGMIENGKIIDLPQFKLFMTNCISHWKLKKKRVLFVEPNETVVVKIITVPEEITEEEMRGYLYLELGESIILPFEDPAIDYVQLSNKQDGQEILLIATPYDLVTSYAKVLRSNYVNPIAADIARLCYYRLYMKEMYIEQKNEEIMMLQLGISSATISVFEQHIPIFMQHEALTNDNKGWKEGKLVDGDYHVAWNGSKEEMLSRFEYVVGDIERILHFYQFSISGGKVIKKIIVVGENPFMEAFVADMTARFDVPIKLIPESIKTISGETVPRKYQLAIGLGLKGM